MEGVFMLIKNTLKNILSISALSLLSVSALANPPFYPGLTNEGNRWTITFYDDSSPTHAQWATQGLCFYDQGNFGTQRRYIWVSDTYPDWNGRAVQEGDQIFMHGDFQYPWGRANGGHDGMEWQIHSLREGAGHWKEWVENSSVGTTIGFGNAKFVRTGKCDKAGFDLDVQSAYKSSLELVLPRDETGKELANPMGAAPEIRPQ
jgi:hypothetical protein